LQPCRPITLLVRVRGIRGRVDEGYDIEQKLAG
jgi:hypothetical protein